GSSPSQPHIIFTNVHRHRAPPHAAALAPSSRSEVPIPPDATHARRARPPSPERSCTPLREVCGTGCPLRVIRFTRPGVPARGMASVVLVRERKMPTENHHSGDVVRVRQALSKLRTSESLAELYERATRALCQS